MSVPRSIDPVLVSITTATDTVWAAARPGFKHKIWQIVLQNKHATQDTDITIKSGTTAISGVHLLKAAGGSMTLQFSGMAWYQTADNALLQITTSAAGTVVGTVQFTTERV